LKKNFNFFYNLVICGFYKIVSAKTSLFFCFSFLFAQEKAQSFDRLVVGAFNPLVTVRARNRGFSNYFNRRGLVTILTGKNAANCSFNIEKKYLYVTKRQELI